MKTKNTDHYTELIFKDHYGKVIIRIQKDFSQISLDSDNGDAYADTNKEILTELRDVLNKILQS